MTRLQVWILHGQLHETMSQSCEEALGEVQSTPRVWSTRTGTKTSQAQRGKGIHHESSVLFCSCNLSLPLGIKQTAGKATDGKAPENSGPLKVKALGLTLSTAKERSLIKKKKKRHSSQVEITFLLIELLNSQFPLLAATLVIIRSQHLRTRHLTSLRASVNMNPKPGLLEK